MRKILVVVIALSALTLVGVPLANAQGACAWFGGSASPNFVSPLDPYTVSCDYGARTSNIPTTVNGSQSSACIFNGWSGNAAQFTCDSPTANGTYTIGCTKGGTCARVVGTLTVVPTLHTIDFSSTPITGVPVTYTGGNCSTNCSFSTTIDYDTQNFSISVPNPFVSGGNTYNFVRWTFENGFTSGGTKEYVATAIRFEN